MYNGSNLAIGSGRYDTAVRCIEDHFTVAPSIAVTWCNPGVSVVGANSHSTAIQLCKKTVENIEADRFNTYASRDKDSWYRKRRPGQSKDQK